MINIMGTIKKYNTDFKTEPSLEVDTMYADTVEFNIIDSTGGDNVTSLSIEEIKELIEQLSGWVGMQIA